MGLSAFLGLLSTAGHHSPPSPDAAGVTQALSSRTGLLAGEFLWEPSRGRITDYFLGRPILFDARAEGEDTLRDLYRSFVRLSPEGRVLDIGRVRNLTSTDRADEYGIVGNDSLALFATRSDWAPPSLSFLNLRGAEDDGHSWLERFQLSVYSYLETGTMDGLGRSDLFLQGPVPGDELSVTVQDGVAQLRSSGNQVQLAVDELFNLEGGSSEASRLNEKGFSFMVRRFEPIPWPHFLANTGRALVGAPFIAWLEGRAFSTRDWLHRATHSLKNGNELDPVRELSPKTENAPSDPSATDDSLTKATPWPPSQLQAIGVPQKGDGEWRAVERPVLPKTGEPLFYRTVLHPDPLRPYAELQLVAMDMRRLELKIGAGYEDPHPDTGPPGSGQIPSDPQLTARVVATFNGAFKAVHGRYGMKAEGRVLVDPVVGAATVTIDESGRAGFGTWGPEDRAEDYVALRQNLDPLIAGGKINPSARKVWGDHLYGTGVAVERSALCLHKQGQIFYAWGTEATGLSLAEGLHAAGCIYAIHLDMNPGHCAFLFNRVTSIVPLNAQGEALDPRMRVNPTRFVRWSPKDFFYLVTRPTSPPHPGIEWRVSEGAQPAPQEVPTFFVGTRHLGSLQIDFQKIRTERLSFTFVAGSEEARKWGDKDPIEGPAPESSIVAWGLGHQTQGSRTGLTQGTNVLVPLHRSHASLVIEGGRLQLLPPSEALNEDSATMIIQLPVLARERQLLPAARELGGTRTRSALCLDPAGDLLIASITHDTLAPAVQALVEMGCRLVVEMDRGSRAPPLIQRLGSPLEPSSGHLQTLLYARPQGMRARTYTF